MSDDYKTTEDLQRSFLSTLTWYFQERPTGFYRQLGEVKNQLITLNERLEESSKASSNLSNSLNRLTFWGVVVTSLGVLVGAGHLILEIIKYCQGTS